MHVELRIEDCVDNNRVALGAGDVKMESNGEREKCLSSGRIARQLLEETRSC